MYIVRILLGIAAQPIVVHPLINDYVKKNSRGTAVSFNSLAVVLGEIIAIGVLFQVTKDLDFKTAFFIAGLTILIIALISFLLLKEPNLSHLQERNEQFAKKTLWE
jgi:sugar phosphate permease